MNIPNYLVVIPAQNEEATIGDVLSAIKQQYPFDIVVVNDGSSDNTAAVVRNHGAYLLNHVRSLGAWKATQTGIRFAFTKHYDGVITLDADGQHLPQEITKLLESAQLGSDVVVGSCISRGDFLRQVAWKFFRFASGINVKDITSGFRLYNFAALRVLSTKEATMLEFQDLGVLLLLRSLGLSIVEVNVAMDERLIGESRIFGSNLKVLSYMATTALVCLTKAIPLRDVRYLKRFY